MDLARQWLAKAENDLLNADNNLKSGGDQGTVPPPLVLRDDSGADSDVEVTSKWVVSAPLCL